MFSQMFKEEMVAKVVHESIENYRDRKYYAKLLSLYNSNRRLKTDASIELKVMNNHPKLHNKIIS